MDDLEHFADQLQKVRDEVKSRHSAIDDLPVGERSVMVVYALASQGDPTFMKSALTHVLDELLSEEPLSIHTRSFMIDSLANVIDDNNALTRLAGGIKRGAPLKGTRGLHLARMVAESVLFGGSKSIEDAWRNVAERENVSESLVKKYWSKWKKVLSLLYTRKPSRMWKDIADSLEESRGSGK